MLVGLGNIRVGVVRAVRLGSKPWAHPIHNSTSAFVCHGRVPQTISFSCKSVRKIVTALLRAAVGKRMLETKILWHLYT